MKTFLKILAILLSAAAAIFLGKLILDFLLDSHFRRYIITGEK